MLISFVLRLAPAALAAGELTGEVEHVLTGERGEFRDGEQLRAWCASRLPAAAPSPRSPVDLHLLPKSTPSAVES